MGKVYVSLFILALVTVVTYVGLFVYTIGVTIFSLVTRQPIGGSILLQFPQPVLFLWIAFPLIVLLELLSFLTLSRLRWKDTPHKVRWDVIPNHNVVVAMTAYNDEASIYDSVQEFKIQPDVREVIVVDNNSTDHTSELALKAGAVVVREQKQGYGHACIRGLREALEYPKTNVVVLVEGDMTFAGKDIGKLVPYLDNVDMVVGTRTTQELTTEDSQLNWFYVWGNMFLAKMTQIKFWDIKHWGRVRLTDVGCTMRAIRAEPLRKIIDNLKVGGDHFSPHMIMVTIANGLKVVEVPVTFRKRWGTSKGAGANMRKGFGVGLRMMWHILTF